MSPSASSRPKAQIVRPPRVCDAIGSSLRNAFGRDDRVTDDMDELLHALHHVNWTRQ